MSIMRLECKVLHGVTEKEKTSQWWITEWTKKNSMMIDVAFKCFKRVVN